MNYILRSRLAQPEDRCSQVWWLSDTISTFMDNSHCEHFGAQCEADQSKDQDLSPRGPDRSILLNDLCRDVTLTTFLSKLSFWRFGKRHDKDRRCQSWSVWYE